MRAFLVASVVGLSALSLGQTGLSSHRNNGTTAGNSAAMRLTNAAVSRALSAAKAGSTISLTVDNRTVDFAPRAVGSMLYIPVRFFAETGQNVIWDRQNMRAVLRSQVGPDKNSLEFDASPTRPQLRPSASMRPLYEKGRLWVPLATTLAAFDLTAEWVPSSNRLNIRTNRP